MEMTPTGNSSQPPATQGYVDPVIEAYKAGIDRTLLRHNLTLTPQQRVDNMIELLEMIEAAQEAGERARLKQAQQQQSNR
jgi:hypothetical protein